MRRYVIYTGGVLDLRAGGPLGYIANLQHGLTEISFDAESEVVILSKPLEPDASGPQSHAPYTLTSDHVRGSIEYHKRQEEILLDRSEEEQLVSLNPAIVHLNYYFDVVKFLNARNKTGLKYKIFYTCHTPESIVDEMSSYFM